MPTRTFCSPPSMSPTTLPSSRPPSHTLSWAACVTSLQAPSPPLMVCLLLPFLHHLLLLPSPHPPLHPPPPPLPILSSLLCLSSHPPPPSPPHLPPSCVCPCFVAFHTFPPPLLSPLSGVVADYPATIPPRISPLSGATADYFVAIPPPLVSPLSSAAADYFAAILPPLVSPLSGVAADYFAAIPPPLVSPLSGTAADYFAAIPPPRISPLSGAAAHYPAIIPPPLMPPLIGAAADYFAAIPSSYLPSSPLLCFDSAIPSASPLFCRCNLWYCTASQFPIPTAAALSLPRTLDFVLDSVATGSVFRDAGVLRNFPRPLSIDGAGETMTMICTGTSSLPCPASPSGAVIGLYVHSIVIFITTTGTSLVSPFPLLLASTPFMFPSPHLSITLPPLLPLPSPLTTVALSPNLPFFSIIALASLTSLSFAA
ncbi:unnamed protein product [Closterium sp. NIES-65]|nr:unnamed protein product [Closterium sp. NIES-65]